MGAVKATHVYPFRFLLVTSLAVIVYFSILGNQFVYDDGAQILRNHYIRDTQHLGKILTTNVWSFLGPHAVSNYYRPVMHFIYMADYALFGYSPAGYHATSVLFHALNAVLVLLIAEALALPALVAVGGAALFAAHPITTEAVAWAAGIPELSYTTFFLLSLWSYMRGRRVVSIVAALLALFSKETALTLPVAVLVYEHLFRQSSEPHLARVTRYAGHFAAAAFYIAARIYSLGGFQVATNPYGVMPVWQFALSCVYLVGKYIARLISPAPFNIFHVFRPVQGFTDWRFLAGVAIVALTGWAAWRVYLRRPPLAYAFALILLPLVPVLNVRAIGHNIFAERYLYLPAAGFALLLAGVFDWLSARRRLLAAALFVLLGVNYSLLTHLRNRDWHDDVLLYAVTLQVSPESNLIRDNLGKTFLDGFGRPELALEQFRECVRRAPDRAEYHLDVALALAELRRYDEALAALERAQQLWPNYPEVFHTRGDLYREQSDDEAAEGEYLRALEIKPTYAEAMVSLGRLRRDQGRAAEAEQLFRRALDVFDLPDAHLNLGLLYLHQNRAGDAERHFRGVLVSEPHSVIAWHGLGRALHAQGRVRQAEEAHQRAKNERAFARPRRFGRLPLPEI